MFKSIYTTRMSGSSRVLAKRFEKISGQPGRFKSLKAVICSVLVISVFALGTIVMADIDKEEEYTLLITNNRLAVLLENTPFVENGEVYVPLRELFTKLGFMNHIDAKMEWNDGTVLIYLVEENLNEDRGSAHTSYMYKIEIGKSELLMNPDELVSMEGSYEFTEPMNLPPVLKGNVTYIPFAYAQRMVERADNGIQSPPDRYDLEFVYSGEVLEIGYPFDMEYPVTSMFGERIHPITGEKRLHSGTDFGVDVGTSVRAGIDGMVTDEGFDENNGYYVVVKNDIGVEILYAHLSTIARHGAYEVKKGDIIGASGNSGKSTGPHLHMEVKINGKYVNPELYFEDVVYVAGFLNEVSDQLPRVLHICGYPDAEYEIKGCSIENDNAHIEIELLNYENDVITIQYYKNAGGQWWLGAGFNKQGLIFIT
ncbi:MAG: peptidoglycan DD-metalloendopeptidase family protein [Clostridia bacterium]|nr:peptidoglycan DD-metalloendopeptidase family protein [Clostridia bacterium]